MAFLGIDPGQSGGIALVCSPILKTVPRALVWPMPETEKDTAELLQSLKGQTDFCLIEAVHSMPKQGVSSSFKFGRNYGLLRGLLVGLGIPFGEITPQRWQKQMECLTRGDKNVSKARAQQLFPNIKVTHAVADALLIAECCRINYGGSWDQL